MNGKTEKEPKNVLMIGMTTVFGGMERYIVNLFMGLNQDLYRVDFLSQEIGSQVACEKQIIEQGGGIVYAVKRKRHFWKHYFELARIFRKKYDIVYYNTLDLVNIDFLIFAKIFNKDAVKIVHAHSSQGASSRTRYILMRIHQKIIGHISDRRYACSKIAGDWMFAGAPYKIINNMIDLSRFHFDSDKKSDMLKKLGLEGKIIWGTVGRIVTAKNPLFLVEIMKYACEIDQNIIFLHIGDGDKKDEMMAKIKEYGLEKNYLLLGAKENVENYYQMMEKFIFPSLYEGLGFSVVEAQAMGIHCIVTDNPQVSKESDMKAGLITWIPLERGAEEWANMIYNLPAISDNLRGEYSRCIIQRGFSLGEGPKKVCEIL